MDNAPKKVTARSVKELENRLAYKAMMLAEKQLDSGEATSQLITQCLKFGSSREQLEQRNLTEQYKLLAAKTKAISEGQRSEQLIQEAMEAMTRYRGGSNEPEPI